MENKFQLNASNVREVDGSTLSQANRSNFSPLRNLAIQSLKLQAGAIREPHVHPNAAQLDYCISGTARIGIVGDGGARQLFELGPGDVSYVPQGHLHWIENAGGETLHMILITSHETPETIELSDMIGGVPNETLARIFDVDQETFERIPEKSRSLRINE